MCWLELLCIYYRRGTKSQMRGSYLFIMLLIDCTKHQVSKQKNQKGQMKNIWWHRLLFNYCIWSQGAKERLHPCPTPCRTANPNPASGRQEALYESCEASFTKSKLAFFEAPSKCLRSFSAGDLVFLPTTAPTKPRVRCRLEQYSESIFYCHAKLPAFIFNAAVKRLDVHFRPEVVFSM